MKTIKKIISTIIEKHILERKESNYKELETIIGREVLEKLSFYLESSQNEKFNLLVDETLSDKSIKMKISLLENRGSAVIIKGIEKGMNMEGKTCTIFYGTNREPLDVDDHRKGYGNERAKKVHLGSCKVHVPKSHDRGDIKGSLWEKLVHLDFSYGDVALKTKTIQPFETNAFWAKISNLLNPLEEEEKQALIFIHGFNNSFEDAAIRATQLSFDLGHKGVTAFFSWPSQAKPLGYISDEATIQYSEKYLTEFLTDFAQKSGAKRIHIIAHSMGNRALLESVNRMSRDNPEIAFGQIILAAPDVDADVFEELAEVYPRISEQTTLYVSGKDKAVALSKWIHSHPRAGFTPPVCTVQSIDTVKVETDVDLLELGHGYFAGHKSLLTDIHTMINFNLNAENREELVVQRVSDKHKYWKFKGE